MTEKVVIEVDAKGARTVKREIDAIGASSKRTNTSVNLLKGALATLGVGLALGASVKIMRSFSQEMSTVKAVTRATDAQFKALRDSAKDLGSTTRFSATQAAEGMTFLARAGFSTDQVLASIKGTLQLAQAGALGLGDAADIASNVLTGFRLEVSQTNRVVDVLALTSNKANTDVLQLGEAMSYVAPVSAGLKVSVEDTSAAIGALSDAGIQASTAGTGLRTAMLSLQNPTSQGAAALNQLGLSAADVDVKTLGLTKVLDNLGEAGLEVTRAIQIAGTRGGPALEVLVQSRDKVKRLAENLKQAEGSAQRMADTMDDNLNGAFLGFNSALEAVAIAIGDTGFESILAKGITVAANALRTLAANMDTAVNAALSLAGALVLLKLPAIVAGFTAAAVAVRGFTVALASNPIGLLAVAISTVISSLFFFRNEIKILGDGITTLGDLGQAVFEVMGESLNLLIDDFKPLFDSAKKVVTEFFFGMEEEAISAVGEVGATFNSIYDFVLATVNTALGLFRGFFNAAKVIFNNLEKVISNPFQLALVVVVNVLNKMLKFYTFVINKLVQGANSLGAGLKELDAFQIALPDGIDKDVEDLGNKISKAFSDGLHSNSVKDLSEGIVNAGLSALETYKQRAKEIAAERVLQPIDLAGLPQQKTLPGAEGSGSNTAEEVKAVTQRQGAIDDINASLEDQLRISGLLSNAAEIENGLLQITNSLKEKSILLSPGESDEFRQRLLEIQALQTKTGVLQSILGPQQTFNDKLAATSQLLKDGAISADQAAVALSQFGDFDLSGTSSELQIMVEQRQVAYDQINAMRQADLINDQTANQLKAKEDLKLSQVKLRNAQNFFGTLAGLATSENRKLAAIGKAAAITQATIDGVLGVQKALASAPPPVNFALAAAVGVVAAANVASIASARRLGGDVNKDQMTRVGEGSRPEIFKNNAGEQFFIPPERGRVEPASSANGSSGSGAPIPGATQPQGNSEVVVNAAIVSDPNELADFAAESDQFGKSLVINAERNQQAWRKALGIRGN